MAVLSDDARIADAWSLGVRNLVIIPLVYVFVYGLVIPAYLSS